MKKTNKFIMSAILIFAAAFSVVNITALSANASSVNAVETAITEESEELFTSISLSLKVENGNVLASVRNDFTFGFATVQVYVYLYSSETYQDAIGNMTFESSNYISDLNIYQTISASKTLSAKYWKAKMNYKIDSASWEEKSTATFYIDSNGKIG